MRTRIMACLLVLAVAGCSSASDAEPAQITLESGRSTASTPAPDPAPSGPPKVGRAQKTGSDVQDLAVTLLRVRRPFPHVPGGGLEERKGYEYVGIEVKMCVTRNDAKEKVSVGWAPWTLSTPSGTVVKTLGFYMPDAFAVPLYPDDHVVRPGRCVRGWIPFRVRTSAKIDLVTYDPAGMDALEWQVR